MNKFLVEVIFYQSYVKKSAIKLPVRFDTNKHELSDADGEVIANVFDPAIGQHLVGVLGDKNNSYDTNISTQVYSFEGENRSSTMYDARKFMDETIRGGLKLQSGSILKSVIHPSAILQVGLVDEALYREELEAGMEDIDITGTSDPSITTSVTTKEPSAAVVGAGVDLDVTS